MARARALLAALERLEYRSSGLDRSPGRLLRARLLLADGQPDAAIREARASTHYEHEAFRLDILMRAFTRLGAADSARKAARALSEGFHFGWEAQHPWQAAREGR